MTFKEPSPETVRDILVDRAEYIRILEAKIVEKESEILGRWESEAEYRRLTDAAHDDLRAESVRLSEELGEALFERDALREGSDEDARALLRLSDLLTAAEAERDVLRAEVSKMRTATAQAAIRSARRVFAPTDEIGDARAEAADHAAVARGRLDTIAEVEARAENAEAALRELHWLGQNWPRYWVVGPLRRDTRPPSRQ